LLVGLLVGSGACGDDSKPGGMDTTPDAMPDADNRPVGDILEELRAIPGMTSVEEAATQLDGYRFFVMEYEQPIDHHDATGAKFSQRMTLLFHDYADPMVVYNSGYFVSTRGFPAGLTYLLTGNQLSMEYRYFGPSRPEPADWKKLDIWQAASDQHRITEALKARLFKGKWLTTGASKGGMTSLFHRRFFPADVDGTVAYVAPFDYPEDAIQSPTNRYIQFLENVGTDAGCRQKLKDFQNLVLARRTAMKTRMEGVASYTVPLDVDHALEFAVEELPFIFWQYGDQSNCSKIPASSATDDAVFKFFDDTIDAAGYGDESVSAYLPYYHQSATQLGYPISDESYLVGLLYPARTPRRRTSRRASRFRPTTRARRCTTCRTGSQRVARSSCSSTVRMIRGRPGLSISALRRTRSSTSRQTATTARISVRWSPPNAMPRSPPSCAGPVSRLAAT
jgi:hypothetical protein